MFIIKGYKRVFHSCNSVDLWGNLGYRRCMCFAAPRCIEDRSIWKEEWLNINCGDKPSCLVISRKKDGRIGIYYREYGYEYCEIVKKELGLEQTYPDEEIDVGVKCKWEGLNCL